MTDSRRASLDPPAIEGPATGGVDCLRSMGWLVNGAPIRGPHVAGHLCKVLVEADTGPMGIFGFSDRSFGGPPPGREVRPFDVPSRHAVLGGPLEIPDDSGTPVESIGLAMGCFWGAEKIFWRVPGVLSTAVGYEGGSTPHPTYDEVCSGRTGHTETVLVTYDPSELPREAILKVFWENHDPTQGDRQGNDVGSQYRSAIFCTTSESLEEARRSAEVYQRCLADVDLGPITSQIVSSDGLPFYYAEAYHQQYLAKNPHGYDCHSSTGVEFQGL